MQKGNDSLAARATLRPATAEDCGDIAKLFLISSDGVAAYIWGQMEAAPGTSLEQIGAQRYAREGVAFSYQNCLIAEVDGLVAGMAHAFVMPESDGEVESDPVLRPYAELEDPGSLYISSIALYPDYRGSGPRDALVGGDRRLGPPSRCAATESDLC